MESVFPIFTKLMKCFTIDKLFSSSLTAHFSNKGDDSIKVLERVSIKCINEFFIDDISAYSAFQYLFYPYGDRMLLVNSFTDHPIRKTVFRELVKWITPSKKLKCVPDFATFKDIMEERVYVEGLKTDYLTLDIRLRTL